ncbi:MepB protein [Bacteroides sp.]|uniref:MepB protein n=1 Tax=Bacteroides sp. TaxID=29523 RepID=UPI0025C58C04|nr:MepB protein [Bacteroides sp.]
MKKKFVKVMLFGALALAATSTVTSCKDYDDDVANLQEQIDKITSTSPVSAEDMKAAISSAKSDLESQLATLKSNLENKDALISELNQKVADLEEKLKNTADKETVNQLTKDLTEAKNDLDALQKLQASDVEKLQGQIDDLSELVNTLNDLKDSFVTKEDLNDYVNSEAVKGIISDELKAALADNGKIASAINDAIRTQVLVKFGSLDDVAALAGENGTVAKVITGLYDAINNDKTGVLARLVELEEYQTALEDKAKAEGFDNIEAVIAEVADLKASFSGIYASESFKNAVSAEVKAAIETQLGDATSSIGKLQKELQDLGVAINNMIQSVVYIPSTIDRSVDFYTLYAKKTSTANYEVAAKSVNTQELQFRISPAVTMTADEFNAKYVASLNAEERNWTRANADEEPFAVKVKDCKAGILTVELTTTSSKSHAISLNIASKADEEGNKGLTPTDINSDYIAVIQSNYYLKTAYYAISEQKEGKVQYDAPVAVDFSKTGTLMISYTTSSASTSIQSEEFSKLHVADIFTPKYELDGTEKDLFEITQSGSVNLKEANKGLVDLIGKKANVKITAQSNYFLEVSASNPNTLGSIEIIRKTKDLAHAFATKELDWFGVGEEKKFVLNSSEIYRDLAVNIPVADYEALTVASDFTPEVTGVRIERTNESNNELTLIVPVGSAAKDYTATFVLESVSAGYTLTVTVPVTIKAIAIDKLAKVDAMWSADKTTTGFTPVTDAAIANSMTANFALTTSFSNLEDVKDAVEAKGGTFTITTNAADIPGVTYDQDSYTFTFDKDDYTGKMTVGGVLKDAQVQFTIKVNYNGRDEETVVGNVEVNNISGTWVAPANRAFELADKMKDYDQISKGFTWKDLRGKTMWAEGTSVTGNYNNENAFAANVKALEIYGLTAPAFVWSADSKTNPNGSAETYLTLDAATGKITFTDEGKTHKFYSAVTYTIEVKATSKWGKIANYGNSNNNKITITIPAEK